VGWADYETGGELGLAPAYLLVVAVVTWRAGIGFGVLSASLAALTWVVALVPFRAGVAPWLLAANGGSRLLMFLVLAFLVHRLRIAQRRLSEVNRQLVDALHREASLARTDSVTGLLNRRGFVEQLGRETARSARSGDALAIAYVDLDHFKALNDLEGHARGDHCLQAVGSAIAATIRKTDVAARLGGDEFAIAMPCTSGPASERVVRRLQKAVQEAMASFSSPGLGASIGLSHFEDSSGSAEELLGRADAAMYEAKRRGKGRVYVTPSH
jgi:diguanylate cyclase (GGDEF)-like protein